jgi:hypothetical protein
MCDSKRDLRSIAREVSISFGSVQASLTDVYIMSKVAARWVPSQLTYDQKQTRFDISRLYFVPLSGLTWFNLPDRYLGWKMVHYCDSESNKQSMQWKHPGSHPPKKFKRVPSVEKNDGFYFYAPEKFRGAYRRRLVRLSVCQSVRPSVRPLSCPEHNLKTLGNNLLKLHTVVEGVEWECSVKEP